MLAEDIFEAGMSVKPQLRKGVWPHLVRVFHPSLESHEDREQYLSKLRLIYDSLKGRLESRDNTISQSQHLYDSIRRDAVRTDPNESFYTQSQQDSRGLSEIQMSENNIEKLVNITAVFTLEHDDISYTQGMTDLLSPILYVMEREDDAYIVFAAMVQRISENFGTWCEGTLKKMERLRHMCSVLDPQLFEYLSGIEEDAFALFFGMVLIECRREFSFASSFHLLEVIWAATMCMQQRQDPNWSPPSNVASPAHARTARIQVYSPEAPEINTAPTFSEWASFMTNRSPDVIRQVFGELQTYSAVPLTRSDSILSRSLSRNPSLLSHSPPPSATFAAAEHVSSSDQVGRVRPLRKEGSLLDAAATITEENESPEAPRQNGRLAKNGETGRTAREKSEETMSSRSSASPDGITDPVHVNVDMTLTATTTTSGVAFSPGSSGGKERSHSDPIRSISSLNTSGNAVAANDRSEENDLDKSEVFCSSILLIPNGKVITNSLSETELSIGVSPLRSPPITIRKLTHTELSDMSSVSSANTSNSNSRGHLMASSRSGASRNSSSIVGHGRGEGGRETEVEGKHESERDGGMENEQNGEWFVIVPDSESEAEQLKQNGDIATGDRSNAEGCLSSTEETDAVKTKPAARVPRDDAADGSEDSVEVLSNHSNDSINLSDAHNLFHSEHFQFPQPVSQDSASLDRTVQTDDNSDQRGGTESTIRERSPNEECDRQLSPIQPFFDTLENIATISSAMPPTPSGARPESALSQVITNLLSMEQSAPAITRETSLTVPFSDSFPLFVCLSIIMQHRAQILLGNLDFVGLSILLNTQAGVQNLDVTLRIARELYNKYREYQRLCFGPRFSVYEVWLDNMGPLFEGPRLRSGSTGRSQGDEEEVRTAG